MILFSRNAKFSEVGDIHELQDGTLVRITENDGKIVRARPLSWFERVWFRICTWGDG